MAQIGSLVVDLIAQTASFNSNIERAARNLNSNAARMNRSVAGVQKQLGLVGSFAKGAAGALAGYVTLDMAKRSLDFAASLGETAAQLGVTTRDLQVYRYAATQAGLSQEEMDAGLAKLSRSLGEASLGAERPAKTFKALGIDIRTTSGEMKTAGEVMPELAEALTKIESPAQRAAVLTQLLGRNGQKMAALLEGGAKGVNDYAAAAERLGIVISDDRIAAADKAADDLAALTTVLQVNIASAVAANAGSIVKLAEGVGKLGSEIASITPRQWKMILLAAGAGTLAFGPLGGIIAGGAVALSAADANEDRRAIMPGPQATGFKFVNGKLVPTSPRPALAPDPEIEGLLDGGGRGAAKVDVFGQSLGRLNEQLAATKLELQAVNENWPDSELDAARLRQQLYNDIAEASPDLTKAQRAELTRLADALVEQERALTLARMSQDIAANSAERYAEVIQALTDDVDAFTKAQAEALKQLPDLSLEVDQRSFAQLEADQDFAAAIGDSFGFAAEEALLHMDSIRDAAEALVSDLARIFIRRNITLPIADAVSSFSFNELLGYKVPDAGPSVDFGKAASAANDVVTQIGSDGSALLAEQANAALGGLSTAAQAASSVLGGSMVSAVGQAVTSTITSATTEGIAAGALQGLTASAIAASTALSAMASQQTVSGISSIALASGAPGFASGGLPGGLIRGPGSGTSDSILAYVSNEEFIVNAAATRKWLPVLQAINAGKEPSRFAMGGLPGSFSGVRAAMRDVRPANDSGFGGSPHFHYHGEATRENARRFGKQAAAEYRRELARTASQGIG